MPERSDVIAAIETERDFQEALLEKGRPDMRPDLQIGSAILAMEENLKRAREAWYTDSGNYPQTMEYLRKVGGLIVQVGEVHGMPIRAPAGGTDVIS